MSCETKLLTPNEVCRTLAATAIRDIAEKKFANAILRIVNNRMQDAVIVIADTDEECTARMNEIVEASRIDR